MKRTLAIAAVLIATAALAAGAASVSYGPYPLPLSITNWTSSVAVQQFNPSLGTLNSITLTLEGYVQGSSKFESLDAAPTTVNTNLSSTLTLQRPDLTTLVVTIPVASTSDNVTAFDLLADFGGTSGKTYPLLFANDSDSATTSSAADKALFTGIGFLTLPVDAVGSSTGSGAGNLLLQFGTHASASASVKYDYTLVPEPGSLMVLGMSLAGMAGLLRRRA